MSRANPTVVRQLRRRAALRAWFGALLALFSLGTVPAALANFPMWKQDGPKQGQTIHTGYIATPGVVRYQGNTPSATGTNIRWVAYKDDLTIVPIGAGEWCQTCAALSGAEACDMARTFAAYKQREQAAGRQAPVLRSGERLLGSSTCFRNIRAQDTYLLTEGVPAAGPCPTDAQAHLVATWAWPLETVQKVVNEVATDGETCVRPYRSALVDMPSGAIVNTSQDGAIGPYTAYYSVTNFAIDSPSCRHHDLLQPNVASRVFAACNTNFLTTAAEVWSPVEPVLTLISLDQMEWAHHARRGYYSFPIRGLAGVGYQISATLRFNPFSTRMSSTRTYWLGTWTGVVTTEPSYAHTTIPLNLTLLTGTFDLENKADDASAGTLVPTVTGDLEKSPWAEFHWDEGLTRYAAPEEAAAAGVPPGQLMRISQAELRNTSVYVFRQSDGRLIGSRWGLSNFEIACRGEGVDTNAPCDENLAAAASYQVLLRGKGANVRTRVEGRDASGASCPLIPGNEDNCYPVEIGQPAVGVELKYGAQTSYAEFALRWEEVFQVVVLNHATGYIGTAMRTNRQGTTATTRIPRMKLWPANLKVWAERVPRSRPDRYRVGSEGAGLTSDEQIQIYTEWLGHDGRPLPEGLMMTGRLAVSVNKHGRPAGGEEPDHPEGMELKPVGMTQGETGTLIDENGQAITLGDGEFPVRPGLRTVLLRLPRAELQRAQHFYIHVDGANPEFQGSYSDLESLQDARPEPATFSEKEVCYMGSVAYGRTCVPRAGPESEAMRERPWMHVPLLVPQYANKQARDEARKNHKPIPPPIYRWVRRPEYHFSLLDLQEVSVTRTLADNSQVVVTSGTPGSVRDGAALFETDRRLDVVWTLTANEHDELLRFDGPRALSWQLGDFSAQADASGNLQIDNPGRVDAEGLLALQLVQDRDEANVLWQYKFKSLDFHLEGGKTTAPVGRTTQVIAELSPDDDPNVDVAWEIVRRDRGVDARIPIPRGRKVNLVVSRDSKDGFIDVEAKVVNGSSLRKVKKIYIGCECEECKVPGDLICENSSVHARWSVGFDSNGESGGTLFLEGDELASDLGDPKRLTFSTMSKDVKAVSIGGAIRQVVGPSTLVDVVTLTPSSYELRFYDKAGIGAKRTDGSGLYDIVSGAQPASVWTVNNSAAGLDIAGHKNGRPQLFQYRQEAATGEMSLGRGATSVEQREILSKQTVGADRIARRKIVDAQGNVASDTLSTYRDLGGDGERLVLEVADPEGAALSTRFTYFDAAAGAGRAGRVQSVENPDGSWASYDYDNQGRITLQSGPWLDAPITDPAHARTVLSSYAPVDAREQAPGSLDMAIGVLTTSPPDPTDEFDQPRTLIESIGGVEVSRTYHAYFRTSGGSRVEITERAAAPGASYGAAGNQRTTTVYEPQSSLRREERRLRLVLHPDGRADVYEHTPGTWVTGYFEPRADGTALRETVTHATSSQPSGVSDKSTREVRIEDAKGNLVREETWVNIAGTYVLASWSAHSYDANQRLTRTRRSNGTESSATWGCCGYDTQTDEQGIMTLFSYDGLGRVQTETRDGITTTHIYDSAGREVETRRSSASGTLTSRRSYDQAGRLQTSTDEAGLVTSYAYSSDGRVTTVTRPGGFTEVTQVHADGRTVSVTGTAAVAQYTSYAVHPDGTQVTEVRVGGAASAQFERTVTDVLGRTVRSERPGYGGTLEVSQRMFDAQGRLVRQLQPGVAATLFTYDELGNQQRMGLDVDGNGALELSGTDRVQETNTVYVQREGGVWQETVERVYASAGGAPTTVSARRTRLGGFASGTIAEAESADVYGNLSRSRTLLNAQGATLTQFVDTPESDSDQVTISVQGRVIASTSASGIATAFTYDGFGRRIGVVDARTGTSVTHYDAQGRVDYVADPQERRTSFSYEPATGRKQAETNASGKVTRFAYSARGELTRTWGDVPYPVEYGYDGLGRRTTMRTYRQAQAWNAATWPEGASGDTTTWEYDPASGLLAAKRDASGAAVQYTYGPGGRLATRRWARTSAGAPLVTTYIYHPATGELASVDYSDATPDVSFAYDRIGRTTQVTDGTGTHTMAYDPTTLALASETRAGLVPAVLTHKRATSGGVLGRSQGLILGTDYDVTYTYDTKGRMNRAAWNVSGQSDSATYTRLPSSELLAGLTYASGVTTTYAYEPTRDLKTQVKNSFGASTISQYDYAYDALGRRTSVKNSGLAFAAAAFNKWSYNDRNELIDSSRYLGTDVTQTNSPVADEYRAYTFDPLGNRITATEGSQQKSYQANVLNEYTTAAGATLSYDADGNLTSDGTRRFSYDAENRLTLVEPVTAVNGSTRVRMVCDYLGHRVQKVVEEYDGLAWAAADDDVRFVYLGWNVIEERRTSGGVSTKKNFLWGLDLSQSVDGAGGIGGLLAVVDEAGSQMAFLYDANGNVGQLVDEQGGVVARYEYSPFGETLVAQGPAANDNSYTFSTKQFDAETGLVYYGYRFYWPAMGRWTQRDPIGEQGGINLYGMVANDPVGFLDALGLERTHLYLVAKSFIGRIEGETGFVPNGVEQPGRIASTDGALLAGALFGLNEDPQNDSKDGAYRLYSRLDVYFDCCGEGNDSVGSGLSSFMEKDGGAEALGGLIVGTIEIRDLRIRRKDSQTWEFRYRATGRPNLLAEPAFNIFSPRTSRFIWHEVLGTFSCKDKTIRADFAGSNFPSHRLWIGGKLAAEDPQGLLINLWRPSENDPSQVRGDRHLF